MSSGFIKVIAELKEYIHLNTELKPIDKITSITEYIDYDKLHGAVIKCTNEQCDLSAEECLKEYLPFYEIVINEHGNHYLVHPDDHEKMKDVIKGPIHVILHLLKYHPSIGYEVVQPKDVKFGK